MPLLTISMEKHLSKENVNLLGRNGHGEARHLAGRLVSDWYVINCVAATEASQNIYGKHQSIREIQSQI